MNDIGEHPLNLTGTLIVVTSAGTEMGTAICRALLNSNALVLGVDEEEPNKTTRSSTGSHFQFYQCAHKDGKSVDFKGSIVKEAERVFGRTDVDVLVVVKDGFCRVCGGKGAGLEHLGEVLEGMEKRGKGSLITCYAGNDTKEEEKFVHDKKARYRELMKKGIACNAVVDRDVGGRSGSDDFRGAALSAKDELQQHIHTREIGRKEKGSEVEKERQLANIVLFLCTKVGSGIQGALVGNNGSCVAL